MPMQLNNDMVHARGVIDTLADSKALRILSTPIALEVTWGTGTMINVLTGPVMGTAFGNDANVLADVDGNLRPVVLTSLKLTTMLISSAEALVFGSEKCIL